MLWILCWMKGRHGKEEKLMLSCVARGWLNFENLTTLYHFFMLNGAALLQMLTRFQIRRRHSSRLMYQPSEHELSEVKHSLPSKGWEERAFRFIQSWMSNKFTAVSQTWATHSPWLPEQIKLPQFPRKPRSPNTQTDNQFYLAPSLSHTGFGCRRKTIAFSKHVITYLSAYFKWRQVFMTYREML